MKLYGGIDLHSNNSVIAIKDETEKEIVCKKLPNDWDRIKQFLVLILRKSLLEPFIHKGLSYNIFATG